MPVAHLPLGKRTAYRALARCRCKGCLRTQPNLKEFMMNDATELEVVELGDAKELTKGIVIPGSEENLALPYRQ